MTPEQEAALARARAADMTPEQVAAVERARLAAKPPEPERKPSLWNRAVGYVGNFSRGVLPVAAGGTIGGALGLLGGPAAPATVPIGVVLGGYFGSRVPGKDALLDKIGYPRAETLSERAVEAAGNAFGGVATSVPAAAATATMRAAPPLVRSVAETMAAKPVAQTIAAPTAAATAQIVGEKTDNEALGLGAGVLAGTAAGVGVTRGAVPTRAQVRTASRDAYRAAEDAGVVVRGDAFQTFAQEAEQRIRAEGFAPKAHPKVDGALDSLRTAAATGKPLSLQEMETLRKTASAAAGSLDRSEARLGAILEDEIDEFVGALGPATLAGGDATVAVPALEAARRLWTRNRRSELVEQAIDRAGLRADAAQGVLKLEHALRQEFKNIASNPRRMRQFSQTEQEQIRRIVAGTPLQNILTFVGRFAPTTPAALGIAGLGGTFGYQVGGPFGAAAGTTATSATMGAVTNGAKWIAQLIGQKNANDLLATALSGQRARLRPTIAPQGALRGVIAAGSAQ